MLVGDHGQNMTTACAAAAQDIASIEGLHPLAEAMNAQTAAVFGLKGSLHSSIRS